ncbi:MAG: hypothetical protein JWO86_4941 [Myxococcaceae bacterium]|nr:hypothetical protein [Myxococcaceae bacterium]
MKTRVLAVFADAPIVFFAVVIGVALTFRIAVGAIRDAAVPEPVAPTFATGPIVTGPEPGLASASTSDASRLPTTAATAEVGVAAKVQPIGAPTPARVPPKPRGHGRR